MGVVVVGGGGETKHTSLSSCCVRQWAQLSLLSAAAAAAWNLAEAAAQRMAKPRLQSSARAAGEQTPASHLCHGTRSLTRTHGCGGSAGRPSTKWWNATLKPGRSRRTTTGSSGRSKPHRVFSLFGFFFFEVHLSHGFSHGFCYHVASRSWQKVEKLTSQFAADNLFRGGRDDFVSAKNSHS